MSETHYIVIPKEGNLVRAASLAEAMEMTRAANETNSIVRRLTVITTIFMPLTLLAGIGGMSEWSMMTGPDNWRIAYPLFLLAMVVIGVSNYFILKRLEKRRRRRTLTGVD